MKKALRLTVLGLSALALASTAHAAGTPSYNIIDLGVIGTDMGSQAFGASNDGSIVVGRSLGSKFSAFTWTAQGGMVALDNLAGRNYAMARDVNNAGVAVGTSATSASGLSPRPVMWDKNGAVTQLALPEDYVYGYAFGINSSGVVAGSVGKALHTEAALFTAKGSTVITATTANGSYMSTAMSINDSGLVVGSGVDPSDLARNVGLVYDMNTGVMTEIDAVPGANGAINFGISNKGYVVGTSMFEQDFGTPFVWSASTGTVAIPLPANTIMGSARGVNDKGWVVGSASDEFAVPFLYADGTTYTLQSLLAPNSGWDMTTNTNSSAMAISDSGNIFGTAIHNGETHAYAMMQVSSVPEPGTWALMLGGLGLCGGVARRRRVAEAA